MVLPHRIAAGAIVLRNGDILLVRYHHSDGTTYLAAPGGALKVGENVDQAVVREVFEETGLKVRPTKVLCIEDLQCRRFKMCKVWILCKPSRGEVRRTRGAKAEGIIEAGWYTPTDLKGEIVFPSIVKQYRWSAFRKPRWQVKCLPSGKANF